MNVLAAIGRPEYFFHPAQIVRRIMIQLHSPSREYETVYLPWGLPLRIQPDEALGSVIRRAGVHELPACECISRLVDPGDFVVDAGANIGQMTSIIAMRAGGAGRVLSFEPHPMLFAQLQFNIAMWQKDSRVATISARNEALSNRNGVAHLLVPSGFAANHGLSFLDGSLEKDASEGQYEVPIKTLDAILDGQQRVGLLKIDVEGHELQVLQGATRLLGSGAIRDILFEEHRTPPTPVTDLLVGHGYTLFGVVGGFLGPVIGPVFNAVTDPAKGGPNYLATRDPDRLMKRMVKRGWSVYRH